MRRYPKKVMVFDYDPSETMVMGSVELKDIAGALSEAAGAVAKMGVNMRMSSAYSVPNEGKAIWSFFGITDPNVDIKNMEKAMKSTPVVLDCQIEKSDHGLIADTLHFPIWTAENSRAVLLRSSLLTSMFTEIKKVFGSGGHMMLYLEGYSAGTEAASTYQRIVSEEMVRKLDPNLLNIFLAMGWGILNVIEKAPDFSKVVMTVKDSFETEGVHTTAPNCCFIRGALAGVVSIAAGRTLKCKEPECQAAGAPECRFELT